jgi:MFS family permease
MIRHPVAILVLLTALNLLNYMDRLVLSAVLPKVQTDLGLSNLVAGSLATVFLLGYFVAAPLFGKWADQGRRKGLMALGVGLWSLATVASGLAPNTATLIVARALVGVGEASYATLAPTIIDDMAPPDRKGRWLAWFLAAGPVGSALGYLVGGAVEHALGWRAAFFVAGVPGLVAAALCLVIHEPERPLLPHHDGLWASAKQLLALPLYRQAVVGFCAMTFAVGGFAFWAPTFLFRAYDLDLKKANFVFGLLTVVTGAAGTLLGGVLSDKLASRFVSPSSEGSLRDRALTEAGLRVAWVGALVATLASAWAFAAGSASAFFVAAGVCEVGVFLHTSPINAVLLRTVPPERRPSAVALAIFLIHMAGDLWSPPLVGALADLVPMRWAMATLTVGFFLAFLSWSRPARPAPRSSSPRPSSPRSGSSSGRS